MLTAVLIVGILAASWFLLVSPKRIEAADLRGQATEQQANNDALVQQLTVLKAQSLDLPKQRAQLAVFRKQIPDNPALPTMIRELTAAGRKVGVQVLSMSPGTPAPATVAIPVAPVATTESGTTESSTSSESTSAAAPPAAAASLYLLPLNLEITGSYFEVEQFLNKLEGMRRSFLVTGFTLTPGDTSADSSTGSSELSLSLTGRVFLSPELASAPAVTSTSAAAPATAQAN